jgi:hypothetical protein
LTAFGVPAIPDEETAIAWVHELYTTMFGEDFFDGKRVIAVPLEERKCWRVAVVFDELMWDGFTDEVVLRMQDGKVVTLRRY